MLPGCWNCARGSPPGMPEQRCRTIPVGCLPARTQADIDGAVREMVTSWPTTAVGTFRLEPKLGSLITEDELPIAVHGKCSSLLYKAPHDFVPEEAYATFRYFVKERSNLGSESKVGHVWCVGVVCAATSRSMTHVRRSCCQRMHTWQTLHMARRGRANVGLKQLTTSVLPLLFRPTPI